MQGIETLRRKNVIILIILGVMLIFVVRLAVLQLFSSDYKAFADSNAFMKKTIYPARGSIFDRNGKLMVYNKPAYDVMITIREMVGLDTLDFCQTVGITHAEFEERISEIKDRRKNPGYSSYTPQLFLSQMTAETYGVLQEKLFHFRGFSVRSRTLREYMQPIASHALGYVGEVNRRDMDKDSYYVLGDYSGRSGIEKEYEEQLRGIKGIEVMLRDAHGRLKGRYEKGAHDIKAQPGRDLTLSIDAALQAYAEKLMVNKRGAIVAIEPQTGEILAYVSAPTYDPGLLVGRNKAKNFKDLQDSPQKIFLNRPIQSNYPPGSTFKPAQALVLLQENIINPFTSVACHQGYYYAPGHKVGCHVHPSPLNLVPAIANSCNAYFCSGYRSMMDSRKYPNVQVAMDTWKDYMVSMGFGYKLGVDLPYEKRGMIPNSKYYNKWYGQRGWRGATIISNAIGQGEVLATPMQIANFCTIIANKGWYITPHLVKRVKGTTLDTLYTRKNFTMIDSSYFNYVQEGMRGAVVSGTSTGVDVPGIEVCGKTGTAQNAGPDHSIFMCFAPRQNPKICLLIFVENGGFGATVAVPMASLLLEKYLKGSIAENRLWKEENLLKINLMRFVSP
ncbi:MAG TPA: penicillin-binding protein 2 [Bacteroidales bacterium]|nr:penicillin-binding protein 2 [Bacteroidales bacterium]